MKLVVAALVSLSFISFPSTDALAGGKKKKKQLPEVQLPADLKKALERNRGQDSFANPERHYGGMARAFAASGGEESVGLEAKSADGGAKRDQQESDIFKLGAPGSKILYLLNNNRGLQIVSYANGVNDPRIMGRVKATGNYSETMYVDHENGRILVLERNWVDMRNGQSDYSEEQSRIVVYDVKDPKLPRIVETIPVKGEIADSRKVGDILYVATSMRPDNRYGNNETHKGFVHSYSLSADGVKPFQSQELALPISRRENMGITEVVENGKYKYYLTAVLSQSGWGWWDSQSQVEVIDISDAKGVIKPVMVATPKGFVDRRQQVSIKDGALITVSNYGINNGQVARWGQTLRYAVETFVLPGEKPEVLTEDEALYRKLHIERELAKKGETDFDAREKTRAELSADSELGIKGRFVVAKNGTLKKLIPDSAVTAGDTTGQSANIRDVRFVNNQLHVFWVPGNMVDPFDIFDISKPREGVKYVNRTQFDGFIEKSRAFEYQGRQFAVGLGWIVDNLNNETGRRRPQAMLFEIIKIGNKLKAVDVAQLPFANDKIWADLNAQDKFVEIRMGSDGKGMMMFKASSWDKDSYQSGGKLVAFDLNQATAEDGDTSKVFAEGGFLVGESGWLRRVFTNTEIDKINTFSDKQLGTFDASEASVLADPKAVTKAVHTLELAREIRGYAVIKGAKVRGVQIVSDGGYWYGNGKKAETELRLVKTRKVDAELDAVLGKTTLAGNYVAHKVTEDGKTMIVATNETIEIKGEKGEHAGYKQIERIHQVALEGEAGFKVGTIESVKEQAPHRHTIDVPVVATEAGDAKAKPNRIRVNLDGGNVGFITIGEGEYLLSSGQGLNHVSVNPSGMKTGEVEIFSTTLHEHAEATLKVLGGRLYLSFVKPAQPIDPELLSRNPHKASFVQHFIAPIIIGAGNKWTHGEPINIPGNPVAIFGKDHLVTEDERLKDIVVKDMGWDDQERIIEETITETALVSLKLEGGKAVLIDEFRGAESLSRAELKASDNGFVYIERANDNDGYYLGRGRRFRRSTGETRFAGVSFDADKFFKRDLKAIRGLELTGYVQLQYVTTDPTVEGGYIGVITSGTKAQIVKWNDKDMLPRVVPVREVNEQLAKNEASTVFDLPSGGYWSYGREADKIHFNPLQWSIEVPGGLSGICQVYLTEPNVKLK